MLYKVFLYGLVKLSSMKLPLSPIFHTLNTFCIRYIAIASIWLALPVLQKTVNMMGVLWKKISMASMSRKKYPFCTMAHNDVSIGGHGLKNHLLSYFLKFPYIKANDWGPKLIGFTSALTKENGTMFKLQPLQMCKGSMTEWITYHCYHSPHKIPYLLEHHLCFSHSLQDKNCTLVMVSLSSTSHV